MKPLRSASALLLAAACGGRVSVDVTPSQVTLATGASQTFTATVTGTSNASVQWSVLEGAAGGSIAGDGTYVAPGTAGSFHVVATSVADPAASGSASVTVGFAPAPDAGPCVAGQVAFAPNVRLSAAGSTSAEVSGAVTPEGTLVAAYCDLARGVQVVTGDGRSLSFAAPAHLAPGYCDPTLAYAEASRAFFLADDCVTADGGYGICLAISVDQGTSFGSRTVVDSFGPGAGLVDRPWLFPSLGGPAGQGATLTWNRYPGPLTNNVGYTLAVDVSADGGLGPPTALTNGSPTSTSAPGAADPSGNAYVVGTLATNLQPASEHGPMALWARADGGAYVQQALPSPGGPIYIYPAVAVTPAGTVLVLYTDEASSVFLIRSVDQGASWSAPLRVNPGSSTPHTLLLWATAGDDGVARFTWYEAVAGASPALWNVFYARSVDEGATVQPPVQVNDGSAFPGTNGEYDENYATSSAPWLGDFTAVLSDAARDYVLFTDARDGASAVYVAATRCR